MSNVSMHRNITDDVYGGFGVGEVRQDSVNSDLQLRTDTSKQWCLIIYLKPPLANGCPMVCKTMRPQKKTLAKKKKKAELVCFSFKPPYLNLSTITVKQLYIHCSAKIIIAFVSTVGAKIRHWVQHGKMLLSNKIE